MTVPRRQVELLEKNRPRQERAKRTYEAILNAAAELLVEVGVERISTNLIAERAGITVPARNVCSTPPLICHPERSTANAFLFNNSMNSSS